MTELEPSRFAAGAAYIDGRYMPVGEAAIPLTDWGYRRSDVTYDVVGVWDGAFFRLDDHIRRFRASMDALHMKPAESDDEIKAVLHRLVRLSGLLAAYVAMDCLRGVPAPGSRAIRLTPATTSPLSRCPGCGWRGRSCASAVCI